ncbi:MAG: hypothetical protein K2P79_13585, partial [Sphingomonas sp.]|nr:hypothetical protein [Sphingomonas sp.]
MTDSDSDHDGTSTRTSMWSALGLGHADASAEPVDFAGHVRQIATIWPFTFVMQLVALGTLSIATVMTERIELIWRVGIECGVLALIGLATLLLLRMRPMRNWPTRTHIRLAISYGIVFGAGLIDLLWMARHLPVDRMQLACFVSLLGAAGVTAMALHPVRAALLGFAAAVAAATILLAGPGVGAAMGLGCLTCLAIATRRLAMLDVD